MSRPPIFDFPNKGKAKAKAKASSNSKMLPPTIVDLTGDGDVEGMPSERLLCVFNLKADLQESTRCGSTNMNRSPR